MLLLLHSVHALAILFFVHICITQRTMTWHTESFAIEKKWWCGEIKLAQAQAYSLVEAALCWEHCIHIGSEQIYYLDSLFVYTSLQWGWNAQWKMLCSIHTIVVLDSLIFDHIRQFYVVISGRLSKLAFEDCSLADFTIIIIIKLEVCFSWMRKQSFLIGSWLVKWTIPD